MATFLAWSGLASSQISWNTNSQRVTATVRDEGLLQILGQVASATGWRVYVDPGLHGKVSAKFKDLNQGEALHLLLGDVNFALAPQTNGSPKLFVFRTSASQATRLVTAAERGRASSKGKVIANELIVRLKPGVSINELARTLGARVIGKIDGLNAYRLQFDDSSAAAAARDDLASNSDVSSVDANYEIDRPPAPREIASGAPPPPQLQLRPPPDTGKIVIGLVDTAVQPLGNGLDAFLLKQLSVAGEAANTGAEPSHGTSMAETMLRSLQAMTQGNTSVQILPVDVYGPNETSSTFSVAAGIVQAVNNGANPINLSLGSQSDSPFLRDVINDAISKNIVVVASAGNDGSTEQFYPAATKGVNAVTAIENGALAPYANHGDFVSLGAPGNSAVYYNGQPFLVQGTSPAAAYASGMIAGYADSSHTTVQSGNDFIHRTLSLDKVLTKK